MRHEPCALERDAEHSVKLIRRDSLLATGDQEHRLQPHTHRNVARFEDGPDLHGKRLAAVVALVDADASALPLHLPIAFNAAAMRADRTTWPDARLDKLVC